MRELLTEGIAFPESPRWHEDRLWFSDVYDFALKSVDLDGKTEVIAQVPGRPSGLGVLPDGRMLMATALEKKLHAVTAEGEIEELADLSSLATGLLNDMAVSAAGRAFVGDTGFNPASGEEFKPGRTLTFAPGDEPEVAAEDVHLHNGCAISADGRTLYVAETFAQRVSRFAVDAAGRLSERAVHAELPSRPDGLCLDAEGCLWVAMVMDSEYVRVDAAGETVERIPSASPFALACVLGGPDRRHLFLNSADTSMERLKDGDSVGRIDVVEVAVAGAGIP